MLCWIGRELREVSHLHSGIDRGTQRTGYITVFLTLKSVYAKISIENISLCIKEMQKYSNSMLREDKSYFTAFLRLFHTLHFKRVSRLGCFIAFDRCLQVDCHSAALNRLQSVTCFSKA